MTVERYESKGFNSRVVAAGNHVQTSGMVAADATADAEGQTRQILAEVDRVLALAGTDRTNILYVQIFVKEIAMRDGVNVAWTEWTGGTDLPARLCVEAKLARPELLVEIAVTAVRP